MMALPSFVEILFIGVGFVFLPIGTPLEAGELESRLFQACEAPYSYELAAWALQAGADPNALSPAGETPLQQVLRQRLEDSSRIRHDENMIMLTLLLKSGAALPESLPPEKNPIRRLAGRLDQATWDVLELKFGEAELIRRAGWPMKSIADLALDDRIIALPPPEGFVPAPQTGIEKALTLAAVTRLSPDAAVFFVPADQSALPLAEVTSVAAFISRRDILGLTGEDDALQKALSLSDDIHGGFFRQYFNNTSYLAASPTTPIPWGEQGEEPPENSVQVIISSHGSLGLREPYQLLYYRIFASECEIDDALLEQVQGGLAGWHFALREANPAKGE